MTVRSLLMLSIGLVLGLSAGCRSTPNSVMMAVEGTTEIDVPNSSLQADCELVKGAVELPKNDPLKGSVDDGLHRRTPVELRREPDLESRDTFRLGILADLGSDSWYRPGPLQDREGEAEALEGRIEPHALPEAKVVRQLDTGTLGELSERLRAERSVEVTVKIGEGRSHGEEPSF